MDYSAFSHGQIKSKLWLCEQLEPHIPSNAKVVILGCWYNVLGFMLLTRNPNKYDSILGVDLDIHATDIANKICDAWVIPDSTNHSKVQNINHDVNTIKYDDVDVIINTSTEHMNNQQWFDNIPSEKLVCLQSINLTDINPPWSIIEPTTSLIDFKAKYPLQTLYCQNTLEIRYPQFGYDRYMLIGMK